MGFIVDCLNVSRLDDPFVHQGYCFSKLAGIHCCTSFDVALQKKVSGFGGEVVTVKHQDSIVVSLLLDDVNPLGHYSVNWSGLLQLLVGILQVTVKKNWGSIWQTSCQLIDPKPNLFSEMKSVSCR